MEVPYEFLNAWNQYMLQGTVILIALGFLILLYHELRILLIRDYKEKYDYVNLHEIKFFWYAVICFIAAGFLFFNTLATEMIHEKGMTWFYVRLFITVSFTVIAYYIFYSLIRIYYPRSVEKRLRKLRNKPRRSPAGNLMRKLSEAEEDAHMDESMIHEEQFHSVDYDVWIDDATGYKKIEKYMAYQHAEECPECGYFTLRIEREELVKAPTMDEAGLFVKHYRCTYCGHREAREQALAKLSTNA
jgi:DNA-directed RNA polymerase subunit RPC12/RpoP